jgi:hypothetical protein
MGLILSFARSPTPSPPPGALAAGAGGRKDWTMPHAIDAGDSRLDSRPLPWSSSPVGARCERCRDYRRPRGYGCRRRHAARAEAAASVSLGFTNRHHIRIFRRDSGSHRSDAGTACFHISACKGTARKGVTMCEAGSSISSLGIFSSGISSK